MPKSIMKRVFHSNEITKGFYNSLRVNYHRIKKLPVFWYDIKQTYRDMSWTLNAVDPYMVLSSELLFQYHKLEKGLCMPGEKRFFGYDPAASTLELVKQWRERGYDENNSIYVGAIKTLQAYRARVVLTPPAKGEKLIAALDAELSLHYFNDADEVILHDFNHINESDVVTLSRIMHSRKSVRSFSSQPIPKDMLEQACQLAISTPSACNRQPWRVYVVDEEERRNYLLSLQNGNRGFGHTAPAILVITTSANCFFNVYERNEPYINGGLFSMSLMLSLQVLGISSCCLNWGVPPHVDIKAHQRFDIPKSERIVMLLAVGYATDDAVVPASFRRPLSDIIKG